VPVELGKKGGLSCVYPMFVADVSTYDRLLLSRLCLRESHTLRQRYEYDAGGIRIGSLRYNRAEVGSLGHEKSNFDDAAHSYVRPGKTFFSRNRGDAPLAPDRSAGTLIRSPFFPLRRFCGGLVALCFLAGAGGMSCSAQTSSVPPSTARPAPAPAGKDGETRAARFVVVLDAAHGGEDGGAQLADSTAEKTVTLALSVRLRSLLGARGMQVVTTREGNVNVDANARAQIANHANAAACVSLHASEAGTGVHIFVSSLGSTEPARFLAWKTAQSGFVTRSLKLANTVNSALEHSSVAGGTSTTGGDTGPIPATLARTSLPGVDSMTCPAIALEMAPIRDTGRKVVTEVTDEQYQTQVVESLAAALLEWRTDGEADPRPGAAGKGRLP
jgi:N-acetylmuramoyl-L-alanine amidase